MNVLLRITAYIFHPLLMPLLGVLCYYTITPRFVAPEFMWAKLYAIAILTVFTPVIVFFLLKNIGTVATLHLKQVSERKYPLMIQCLLVLLIINMIFKPYDDIELYYFFVGVLFTSLTALFLVMFKFKVSLHQMAIAGVTIFLIGLSIHFKVNALFAISLFFIINGLVAASRLHTRSHTITELAFGFFIGAIPQFLMFGFWV